jgi:hypothetical protein
MEHYGKRFFPHLIAVISSGPVLAMVLAKEGAIQAWRDLIGPTLPSRAVETHPQSLVERNPQKDRNAAGAVVVPKTLADGTAEKDRVLMFAHHRPSPAGCALGLERMRPATLFMAATRRSMPHVKLNSSFPTVRAEGWLYGESVTTCDCAVHVIYRLTSLFSVRPSHHDTPFSRRGGACQSAKRQGLS